MSLPKNPFRGFRRPKGVRGTSGRPVNIDFRFLRIFLRIDALIRNWFQGGARYPLLPTRLQVSRRVWCSHRASIVQDNTTSVRFYRIALACTIVDGRRHRCDDVIFHHYQRAFDCMLIKQAPQSLSQLIVCIKHSIPPPAVLSPTGGAPFLVLSYVYSKQPIFWANEHRSGWERCGVHDRGSVCLPPVWDLSLPLA